MSTDFSSFSTARSEPPVTAPSWPAYAAAATAVLAFVMLVRATHSLSFAITGYVLGALVAPALTVVYRFLRRSAATSPFFIPRLSVERLVVAVLAVGILAGVVNAWFVATELAKQ